ncbi:ankyrin repeat-containing domain protein [Xylaria intraflava]|nr:ankyrin repeat-containing domain protein [Xylaria intraflava]
MTTGWGGGKKLQEVEQTHIGDEWNPLGSLPTSYSDIIRAPQQLITGRDELNFLHSGDTSPTISIPYFPFYQPRPLHHEALSSEDDGQIQMTGEFPSPPRTATGAPDTLRSSHHISTSNALDGYGMESHAEGRQWNAGQGLPTSLHELGRSPIRYFKGPFTQNSQRRKTPTANAEERDRSRSPDTPTDRSQRSESTTSGASSRSGSIDSGAIAAGSRAQRKGVDKGKRGHTPLFQAVAQGQEKITMILAGKCNNLNATDELGQTILHVATDRGHTRIVEYLLRRGVDLDVCDHEGNTALHLAVGNGYENIVVMLVDAGADTEIVSRPRR